MIRTIEWQDTWYLSLSNNHKLLHKLTFGKWNRKCMNIKRFSLMSIFLITLLPCGCIISKVPYSINANCITFSRVYLELSNIFKLHTGHVSNNDFKPHHILKWEHFYHDWQNACHWKHIIIHKSVLFRSTLSNTSHATASTTSKHWARGYNQKNSETTQTRSKPWAPVYCH